MKKVVLTSVFIFMSTLGVSALGAGYSKVAEKKLFNGETLQEFKLPNGLRVLLVPRHQAKVLTYQTWFSVGSLQEKLDPKLKKTGLAHLFEHMMFRGSEKYPDGKFDELTSRMGGEKQNATTFFYRTNYFESVPSSQLKAIMELESDRMQNLKLNKELFEKEKGAVVGELRRANDTPMRMAWDETMRLVYQQAPYRYTVLGTEDEIKGFSLEEAQYFYKTFYAPNNGTLIVVGDTAENELMPLVEKYYGEMASQSIPDVKIPLEPTQTKERRFDGAHKQATSEILVLAYRMPAVDHPDVIPLALLSTHLSKGMEARLRKLLVDTGIAVNAAASISHQPDIFEVMVSLAEQKKAEQALAVIDQEVSRLQTNLISKESFERALNQEKLSLYGDIGDNSELGNALGEYAMLNGNYLRGFEIIDGFKQLTPKDLMSVSKKYLNKKSRSVIIVRPLSKKLSQEKK